MAQGGRVELTLGEPAGESGSAERGRMNRGLNQDG
jgi:hypothetical protein